MARWSYLIPRLIILGLVVVALWISSDPIIKSMLEKSGEDAIGAKVEIGHIRTAILSGKVYLEDVQIADPRNPMLNMIQADMAYIQLDPRSLLRRKIVVESGTTSKIKFGVPRTDTGALERIPVATTAHHNLLAKRIPKNDSDVAQTWLDSIKSTVPPTRKHDLETTRLSLKLMQKWPAQFDAKRKQFDAVQDQLESLRDIVKSKANANPLRSEKVQTAFAEMESLHQEILHLQNSLGQLQNEAMADRDALLAAKRHDEENFHQAVTVNQFNSQTISKLLLTESQTQYVDEALHWFRWFQSTIPDPDKDFCAITKRGKDIVFRGVAPSPRLLIKSLEIDGEGHLAGQHLNFVGTANNLSVPPSLHDEPTSFHLRALGKQHLIVDCILDRRNDLKSDTLNVQFPSLNIDAQLLGNKDTISVSMGPSRMQAEIAIRIQGDQLSGELVFQNSDVLMHVESIHALAGGNDTVMEINRDLASVDSFQTYIQLSGTLEDPEFEFQSDLGNQFAATMNQLAVEQMNQNANLHKEKLSLILEKEVQQLDLTIQKNLRELVRLLNGKSETIAELKEINSEKNSGLNRIR